MPHGHRAVAAHEQRPTLPQEAGNLHSLGVGLDRLHVRVDRQRLAHHLRTLLTQRVQRSNEHAHQDRMARVHVDDRLHIGSGLVDARVDLDFGALGQPGASSHPESVEIALDHVVRFHDAQGIEVVLAAFHDKTTRI